MVGIAFLLVNLHNWQPLLHPISLSAGYLGPFRFQADLDSEYNLDVEVERKIASDRLDCMLGIKGVVYPAHCHGLPSLIDISWRISDSGKVVAEGNSANYKGGMYSVTISRRIGGFRASKGHSYSLDLLVNKDADSLNVANPKISVEVAPLEYKGYALIAQFVMMGAALFALIGIAFGVYGAGRALSRRILTTSRSSSL